MSPAPAADRPRAQRGPESLTIHEIRGSADALEAFATESELPPVLKQPVRTGRPGRPRHCRHRGGRGCHPQLDDSSPAKTAERRVNHVREWERRGGRVWRSSTRAQAAPRSSSTASFEEKRHSSCRWRSATMRSRLEATPAFDPCHSPLQRGRWCPNTSSCWRAGGSTGCSQRLLQHPAALTSSSVTGRPASAQTCAMPLPICPAPITPTRAISGGRQQRAAGRRRLHIYGHSGALQFLCHTGSALKDQPPGRSRRPGRWALPHPC